MVAPAFPIELGRCGISKRCNDLVDPAVIQQLLQRHAAGDDGDLSEDDHEANRLAIREGSGRILSSYRLSPSLTVWVITEGLEPDEKRTTTVLLPIDY